MTPTITPTYRKNPAASTYKVTVAAINDGAASNGIKLSIFSVAYARATVMAVKYAGSHSVPTANDDTVYIGTEDNCRYATPLAPGESMELPPNGDLSSFYLMSLTIGDGVIITYQT